MNVSIIIPLLNESESINELNDWIFKAFTNTDLEFEAYYELRWRVLRKPWGQARGTEHDEYDGKATHIAAFNDSRNLVGGGRLQLIEDKLGQVRYMAVEPNSRNQALVSQYFYVWKSWLGRKG